MKKTHFAIVMPWHISEKGGGAEVQAWFLAEELAKRGFRVSYICQTSSIDQVNTLELVSGVSVHRTKAEGIFPWLHGRRYYELLTKINPDIVIQRTTSYATKSIGDFCRKFRKKFIWISTDNLTSTRWMHLKKHQIKFPLKAKPPLTKITLSFLNSIMSDLLRQRGMKDVSIAFTQNNVQKETLLSTFGLRSFQMISGHHLPTATDSASERFHWKKILWCANLGLHKRPELFLQLAKAMPNQDITFTMVGGHGDQAYVENLMKDKSDRLNYLGRLPFEEALKQFDQTSLFINTSNAGGDGFPNTFIQAWLRGVPTVTMGFDPNQLIQQQELGFVCKNIQDMRDKVQLLLTDPALYSKISQNCISYATQNHSIKKMTDHFLDVVLNESTPLH